LQSVSENIKAIAMNDIYIIKSETGKSIYVCGEGTKNIKDIIKSLPDTMFPPKWVVTKKCWNVVPKKNKYNDVLDHIQGLTGSQIHQHHQKPDISKNVTFDFQALPKPSLKSLKPLPRLPDSSKHPNLDKKTQHVQPPDESYSQCIAITLKKTQCKNTTKGKFCRVHEKMFKF
jgi:hypothetical protein